MTQPFYLIAALYAVFPELISPKTAALLTIFRIQQQEISAAYIRDVRLLKAVEKAENETQNNIIQFPDYFHRGDDSHPDGVVVKAFIGAEINLTCTPEVPVGQSAAGFVEHLIWKHNGWPVRTDFAYDHPSFTQTHNSNYSILRIHPVTHRCAGRFECIQRCLRNPASFCIRREYVLRAVPQGVHNVFIEPIQLLPTSNATKLSFSCTLQTECIPSSDPYFVWKYGGMFIAAPKGHFLHRVARLQLNGRLGIEWSTSQYKYSTADQQVYRHCSETMTLTILRPDYRRGNIECWARTDLGREQWFVQKKRVD